jgi:MinD-like ATPase involved in chromosome partitioning or flagellar assembly/DNA-binding NarL/FixJ family response regulator
VEVNNKIKLYIVDYEEQEINHIEELFYKMPHLGVSLIGYSHNYNHCLSNVAVARKADVFIISAHLPDQMGYDLIPEIKRVNPSVKIIVKVDKNTRNLVESVLEKGADETIFKPYSMKKLLEKISIVTGVDVEEEADSQQYEEEVKKPNRQTIQVEYSSITEDSKPVHEENEVPEYEDVTGRVQYKDLNQGQNDYQEDYYQYEEHKKVTQKPKRALFDAYSKNPITEALSSPEENVYIDKPKVVCTFTSAGGTGKTALIANVAAAIHKYAANKPRICIVDFNLLFPSIIFKFHLEDIIECKRDIYDLSEDVNHLDEELIRQSIKIHYPTGINILNTPFDPESIHKSGMVTVDAIEQIIVHLKEMFDVILIDTSTNIKDDTTIFSVQMADKGVLVFEPDLANLMNTKKYMHILEEFEKTLDEALLSKMIMTLNKENPKSSVRMDTIKTLLLGKTVDIRIPEDIEFTHLSNSGRFVINENTVSAGAVIELAKAIYPFGEAKKVSNGSGSVMSIFKKLKK